VLVSTVLARVAVLAERFVNIDGSCEDLSDGFRLAPFKWTLLFGQTLDQSRWAEITMNDDE